MRLLALSHASSIKTKIERRTRGPFRTPSRSIVMCEHLRGWHQATPMFSSIRQWTRGGSSAGTIGSGTMRNRSTACGRTSGGTFGGKFGAARLPSERLRRSLPRTVARITIVTLKPESKVRKTRTPTSGNGWQPRGGSEGSRSCAWGRRGGGAPRSWLGARNPRI